MSVVAEVQEEVREWRAKNFPNNSALGQLAGMTEELGEIAHAVNKGQYGIRGMVGMAITAKVADGLGDLMIFAMGLADHYGLSLEECVVGAWDEVKHRDWLKNKETGVDSGS